jgi:ADP-ribose pyrophosphatase YjhB (NUDIX family)
MPDNNTCTHAGGIVFRRNHDAVEYLLIGPSKERPGEWLFPKGHIEIGEDCRQAAVREVEEEAGVVAKVLDQLDISEVKLTNKTITVKYYLMEMTTWKSAQEKRRTGWFPYDEAIRLVTHEANRVLLLEAEKKRASMG